MTAIEAELRAQFQDALADIDPPVTDQFELLAALPDGVSTRFEAGEFSMTVAELATTLNEYQEFPYDSVQCLIDDVLYALKEENLL